MPLMQTGQNNDLPSHYDCERRACSRGLFIDAGLDEPRHFEARANHGHSALRVRTAGRRSQDLHWANLPHALRTRATGQLSADRHLCPQRLSARKRNHRADHDNRLSSGTAAQSSGRGTYAGTAACEAGQKAGGASQEEARRQTGRGPCETSHRECSRSHDGGSATSAGALAVHATAALTRPRKLSS
jgi:hypothetical protein